MSNKGYSDGVVRYPVSVIDHIKQSEDPAQKDIDELKEWQQSQDTAVPDNVIEGVKEIENFLAGSPDTETLSHLLSALTNSLNASIAAKYVLPLSGIPKTDLAISVQSSLDKAESAIQEHQSLENYYVKDESRDLAAIMSLSALSAAGTTTVTSNPEWQIVYTDNTDHIMLGKRQDNTWYMPIPLSDVLDVVIGGLSS